MIQNRNTVISKAGYYILSSDNNKGLSLPFKNGVEYTEIEIPSDIECIENHKIYKIGNLFYLKIDGDYNTKSSLMKMLFTLEDQIAIILNKNDNAESKKKFAVMQDWRKYFSQKIAEVKELIKKEEEENGEME